MTTLTDIMQGAYRRLGQNNASKLTSGSTTTAIDTTLSGKYKNNSWKDGTLFVERTTDGLAPQGEFQRISSYVNTSQTFTVDTAFSQTLGAGDVVVFVSGDYPALLMIDWINDALKNLGEIVLIDSSSVSFVVGTNEYSLPAAWKDVEPYRIDISVEGKWVTIPQTSWTFIPPATVGAVSKVNIADQTAAGALRFWYRSAHPVVSAYSDIISDSIDVELLVLATVEMALEWYNAANSGGDAYIVSRLNEVRQLKTQRMETHPVERPAKVTKVIPTP